jgi:hypothetical protein
MLTVFLSLGLYGCDVFSQPEYDKENAVSCYYRHDQNTKVIYEKQNITKITIEGVLQYQIIDVEGNNRMFNEFEFEDFICDKPKMPVIVIVPDYK